MSTITFSHSGSSIAAAMAARPVHTRVRLTPRGRAVMLFVIALPIVLWLLVAQLNGGAATGSLERGSVEIVMVQPGESLFRISLTYGVPIADMTPRAEDTPVPALDQSIRAFLITVERAVAHYAGPAAAKPAKRRARRA